MSFISITAFLSLLSGFFVIGVGLLVFFKNKRARVNQLFSSFAFAMSIWLFSSFMMFLSGTDEGAIFWDRMVYVGVVFIPFISHYFSIAFTRIKGQRKLIYIGIVLSIIFLVISRTDYFVANELFKHAWGVHTKARFFHHLFMLYFTSYILLTYYNLYKCYKTTKSPIIKQQAKYIFLAFLIFIGVGSIAYLPAYGVGVPPFGYAAGVVFTILVAYSIIRYRLMNIKLIVTRSFIFFFLTLSVTAAFVLISSLAAIFFSGTMGANQYVVWIITAMIIVLLLDPLKNGLAQVTDRFFFKGKIDYDATQKHLTQILAEVLDVKEIITQTQQILTTDLKINDATVLLSAGDNCYLFPDEVNHASPLKKTNRKKKENCYPALTKFLKKNKDVIVIDELERKISDAANDKVMRELKRVYKEIEKLETAVVAPVFRGNEISALLLLDSKTSGDVFSDEDISLLEIVGPQLASSLFKASLYQEAQLFNIKLQEEVDRATKDLKQANLSLEDRNKSLLTLQKFSNVILNTLDPDEVTQKIVNAIPEEIEYCRTALLTLVDGSGKNLQGKTIPLSTPIAKDIVKLVGKNFDKYKVPLTDKKSLLAKAVKTKRHQASSSLADFLCPPLSEEVVVKIQNIPPAMQSAYAFPLLVGEKVLGVLHFSLMKKENNVSVNDLRMMQAVADEIALALERAEVYSRLQKINVQLKDANEHLKELDNAKSEFMSIASHQLRTPLSGIMGYLSMILDGDYGKTTHKQLPIVKEVFEASQRLIRLVNLFLNVTRIEAGRLNFEWVKTDMKEIVKEQIHELKPPADKKKLKLVFKDTKTKLPDVAVDVDKIKDVILNLIDNAIKYTEKGEIEVSVKKKGASEVEIMVCDNGVGIKPEDAKELFNKFVRGDGMMKVNPDGAGLGLFIAKKIVEGHNGKIWAESDGLGKGSCFHVALPIEQKKKQES